MANQNAIFGPITDISRDAKRNREQYTKGSDAGPPGL